MNKTILVIGIIFLLIGVGVTSPSGTISKKLFIGRSNNSPPYAPSNYTPCGAVSENVVYLSWDGGDPDSDDSVTYDVYFGNTTPPPKVATVGPYPANQTRIEYGPVELECDTNYYWKIFAYDEHNEGSMGYVCNLLLICENNPPCEPSDPYPIGNDIIICPNLSWSGGDPDGDNVTYDVYFCTNPVYDMQQIAWNISETWFQVWDLDFLNTYYWFVVAWDEYGLNTTGPLWHFTTEKNYPPNPAENPIPFDGDPAVPTEGVVLCWNGSDPNICDTLRYDLYFDDINPPVTQQMYKDEDDWWEIPDGFLTKYETYYWRVDTYDKMGEFTEGYVWHFSTNYFPPSDPIIDGPLFGGKNKKYNFTFLSTDPDNTTLIKYHVQWDDGTENLTELYPSGEVVTLCHSWSYNGEKVIKARAIDEHNLSSGWSEYIFIVPRNKVTYNSLLLRLLERFPFLGIFINTIQGRNI